MYTMYCNKFTFKIKKEQQLLSKCILVTQGKTVVSRCILITLISSNLSDPSKKMYNKNRVANLAYKLNIVLFYWTI